MLNMCNGPHIPSGNPFECGVNFGPARDFQSNCPFGHAIVKGMWRLEALLWSAVEWCEERAARRRILYCIQQQHRRGLSALQNVRANVGLNARVRAGLAFVFLLLAGRR
jgi:hypothetical protein